MAMGMDENQQNNANPFHSLVDLVFLAVLVHLVGQLVNRLQCLE
tara:strand:+ start:246 stop:377 length:132 start_codon:yes stop_codon:yes gene_type:complete